MATAFPRSCFIPVPLEIPGDWASRYPREVNLLFQAQWAARSATSLEDALRLMLDLSSSVVPWEGAAAAWYGGGDPVFLETRGSAQGREEPLRRLFEALRRGPAHPAVLDAAGDPSVASRWLEPLNASSLLAVPLGPSGREAGSLVLLRNREPGFTADEARMMRLFALSFEPVLDDLAAGDRARELAFVDRLTGVFTRRYFDQHFRGEVARAARTQTPVALLLLEIDALPRIRAERGAAVADALLQAVVAQVNATRRRSDTLARIEPETLAVILPGAGKEEVAALARRLFEVFAEPLIPEIVPGGGIRVDPCMGAAVMPEHGDTPESLWDAAQESLAKARAMAGRRYYVRPGPEAPDADRLIDRMTAQAVVATSRDAGALLGWIARLCREVVPADRISLMVREDGHLVVQEAFGFEGRDQVIRTTRVPLDSETVSGWVARHRRPLLVPQDLEADAAPLNRVGGYRTDSFLSVPLLAQGELEGVVHFSNRSDGAAFTPADRDRFLPVADRIGLVLHAFRRFSRDRQGFLRESLSYLVDMVEDMIPGMAGHSRAVADWAGRLARARGYDEETVERIVASARFHDLGEASFRIRRLAEPRRLGPRERRDLAEHPLLGWRFLEQLGVKGLDRDAIVYHHERVDGSGYMGRQGEEIPPAAKIVAVAEAFVGLTSERAYRPPVAPLEAVAQLEQGVAGALDGEVLAALRELVSGSAP
ncbi:bifunctional diguanylate cyclase/phosphohydrolase [Deferrisoma palaeochoriense]